MGGLSCSNPNSCHPFLLTFGLITVFLMAFYLISDTLFDNARPKKCPILSMFNTAKPRPPPVRKEPVSGSGAVRFSDGGADGFKALRYDDTGHGNAKPLGKSNDEGSSKDPVAPGLKIKKPTHSPVHKEADPSCRPADSAIHNPKYEGTWHGNVKPLESGHAREGPKDPLFPRSSNEKPRPSDLEFRPATFVGEGPDGFQAVGFNPYTWHGNVGDLKKGNGDAMSQEKV